MTRDRASIIQDDVTDAAQILARLDELEKRVAKAEREEYRALYLQTMERCLLPQFARLGLRSM